MGILAIQIIFLFFFPSSNFIFLLDYCQYCGRELTKEEKFTHSCKKKLKYKR